MNLIHTIEQFDPGHFGRREEILEDLREKAKALGFFPLSLSWNDVECFWIRLEPNETHKGKKISFQKEYIDDEFVLKLLKDVARYEFNGNTL
jgi:hypothetical protein